MHSSDVEEEFEDTKGVIIIRISKRNESIWIHALYLVGFALLDV
jgi:hypothetical protein